MQQEINGRTAVYGLIGNPVGHSFSPLIHNTLAEGLEQNLVYTTFPVTEADRIGDAVHGAYALGVQGMNVTVPYKSAVIPFLNEVDPVAKAIGAVNTLVRTEDGYKGYNTDYLGLRRALEEMGIDLPSVNVILIGAGGAARAAGFMCGDAGVAKLSILNRTKEKADSLAGELAKVFPVMEIHSGTLDEAADEAERLREGPGEGIEEKIGEEKDCKDGKDEIRSEGKKVLAIQCTNVGLAPLVDAVPVEDPVFYQRIDAAYDCIYNPEETRFLQLVHAAGKPGRNGMDMLLWQAILAFRFWTGKEPEQDLTERVRNKLHAFIKA